MDLGNTTVNKRAVQTTKHELTYFLFVTNTTFEKNETFIERHRDLKQIEKAIGFMTDKSGLEQKNK